MCVLRESAFSDLNGERLLDLILIEAPGTIIRLDLGANVLFANCGQCTTLIELARLFPRSRFFGLELSAYEVAAAREKARAHGLQNIRFESATEHLPHLTGIFHFALRTPHPHGSTLANITGLLQDGGLLFDLHDEALTPESYGTAAMTVLRNACLPEGFCTIARKERPLPPVSSQSPE